MGTNNHEDENRKSFWKNNWQWVVSMILFVVFAGFMIYNTWPQKHPETQELLNGLKQQIPIIIGEKTVEQKTTAKNVPVYDAWGRVVTAKETSSTTKKINLPESYVISKENMDKALTAVAYAARAEAQNEYKENFSILLTILTIFSIAWPAIIALLQFKFNDKQIQDVAQALSTAEKVNKRLEETKKQFNLNNSINWNNMKWVYDILALREEEPVFKVLYSTFALNCLVYKIELKENKQVSGKDLNELLTAINKINTTNINYTPDSALIKLLNLICNKIINFKCSTQDSVMQNIKNDVIKQLQEKIGILTKASEAKEPASNSDNAAY